MRVGVSNSKREGFREAVRDTSPIRGDTLNSVGCYSAMFCTVSTTELDGGWKFSLSPARRERLGGAAIVESGDGLLNPK